MTYAVSQHAEVPLLSLPDDWSGAITTLEIEISLSLSLSLSLSVSSFSSASSFPFFSLLLDNSFTLYRIVHMDLFLSCYTLH